MSKDATSFAPVADPEAFAQVGLGYGAVLWAYKIDAAPEVMYEEFTRNGV